MTEAMHRGNHLTFTLPGDRTLAGRVITVGRDHAILHADPPASREVTVRLPARDPTGSTDPYRGPQELVEIADTRKSSIDSLLPSRETPETFQAVLHQYDFGQQQHPTHTIDLGTTFHPTG